MEFQDQTIIFIPEQQADKSVTITCMPKLSASDTEFLPERFYKFKITGGKVNGGADNTGTLPVKSNGDTVGWEFKMTGDVRETVGDFFLAKSDEDIYFAELIDAGGTATDSLKTYASNPSNIVQSSAYRFVSDAEKTAWNDKTDKSYVDAVGLSAKSSGDLIGESELLPFGADQFNQFPNGWIDNSAGGLAPRALSSYAATGDPKSGYTRFEATNVADALEILSPAFRIDASKFHEFYVIAQRLSGAVSMELVAQFYTSGEAMADSLVLFTNWNPSNAGFDEKLAYFYPYGSGEALSVPNPNADRCVLILRPTKGTVGAVGIQKVYAAELGRMHNDFVNQGGGHEAHYDGANCYISTYFSGFITKMTKIGTKTNDNLIDRVPAVYSGPNAAHEIVSTATHLYTANSVYNNVNKYDKATRTLQATLAVTGAAHNVLIIGDYLFVSTDDGIQGRIYRIRLSDFTILNTWNVNFVTAGKVAQMQYVAGSLWIHAAGDGKVFRVNITTGAVQATINPPPYFVAKGCYGMGALNNKLYIAYENGVMVEFDSATNAISNQWRINVASKSQIKSDGEFLYFVTQDPVQSLIRFDPRTGATRPSRMRGLSGGKWCEVVGGEIWCGGFDSARIMRFAR